MPRHGKDRLWMELDALNRKLSMADTHYLVVIDRLGGHCEAFREALSFRDKRMISRSLERTLYSTEDPFSIMSNWAGLAVAESLCSNYPATERVDNPLMSQADAQGRDFVAHISENGCARPEVPGIAGGAGAGGDYDPVRREILDACDVNLIAPFSDNLGFNLTNVRG